MSTKIDEINIQKRQCREAADMVVDALIDAGVIFEKNIDIATKIVEEELLVRKALQEL